MRLLIVCGEQAFCDQLADCFSMAQYDVIATTDLDEGHKTASLGLVDVLLVDEEWPPGCETTNKQPKWVPLHRACIGAQTIVLSDSSYVEKAVDAMRHGAAHYLRKPVSLETVLKTVQSISYNRSAQDRSIQFREAKHLYRVSEVMARSVDMHEILDVILRAALDELSADAVTLWLQDQAKGFGFHRHHAVYGSVSQSTIPSPEISELLLHHRNHTPVLADALSAHLYFTKKPTKLTAFASVPLRMGDRIIGMACAYSFSTTKFFTEGKRKVFSVLASRAATAIENARLYENLTGKNQELLAAKQTLEQTFEQTISGFAQALEEADTYTRGHSERVARYAGLLAQTISLSPGEVTAVMRSAVMHDIGKVGIPHQMINKAGRLTDEEAKIFREHPDKGKRILENLPCLHGIIDGCWCHHERYDGHGYPRGLSGHNIPLVGRIVAIADAYDAMTSDRAYRKALPTEVAQAEIKKHAGTQFDPELSKAFLHVV